MEATITHTKYTEDVKISFEALEAYGPRREVKSV
jgi:hypothetical protein